MARTERARPSWFVGYERHPKSVGYDVKGRDRFTNGYDRRYSKDIYEPFSGSPKGYCTWCETGASPKSRREAKKGASHIMRRRARRELVEQVATLA